MEWVQSKLDRLEPSTRKLISRIFFLGGVLVPLGAIILTIVMGYRIVYRAAGAWGCLIAAALQLITWLAFSRKIDSKEKLEFKLTRFWVGKKLFSITWLLVFFIAPVYALITWGDWVPMAIVYGSVIGGCILGSILIHTGKSASDSYSNFPYD